MKQILNFLTDNSFTQQGSVDSYNVYSNGYLEVHISKENEDIVFVNDRGPFLYLPFNYYALIGGLIEYRQLAFNYTSA